MRKLLSHGSSEWVPSGEGEARANGLDAPVQIPYTVHIKGPRKDKSHGFAVAGLNAP